VDRQPLISVVIPVYNAGHYIEATLDSIVAQQGCSFEVILIDDCSTDDSQKRIEPYLSDAVHYFRLEKNCGGPSKPRNIGVDKARGEFIALFDSDDVMLPGKLQSYADFIAKNTDCVFASSSFQTIDEQGSLLKKDFLADYQSFRKQLTVYKDHSEVFHLAATDAYTELLKANFIGNSSVLVKKSVFVAVGGFDETIKNSEDFDLWLRITEQGYDLYFFDQVLHQYRIQSASISFRSGSSNARNRVHVLEKHWSNDLTDEQRLYLAKRLFENYFSAGFALRQSSDFEKAKFYFKSAWKFKKTPSVIKQIFLCLLKVSGKASH